MNNHPIYVEYPICQRIRLSKIIAEDHFDDLRLFLDAISGLINRAEKRDTDAIIRQFEEHHMNKDEIAWEEHYPYWWQDIIGLRFWRSYTVSLIAAAEDHLIDVCNIIQNISKSPIGIEDLRGGTIARCKKYLTTFGKFVKPSQMSWDRMDRLYVLRNILIHSAAVAQEKSKNERKIKKLAKESNNTLETNPVIEVTQPFCEWALENVKNFILDDLLGELERKSKSFMV